MGYGGHGGGSSGGDGEGRFPREAWKCCKTPVRT